MVRSVHHPEAPRSSDLVSAFSTTNGTAYGKVIDDLMVAFDKAGLEVRSMEAIWDSIEYLLSMGEAPNELFDEIIVVMALELKASLLPAFLESPFGQELSLVRRVLREKKEGLFHGVPTEDSFDWIGCIGVGGYGSIHVACHRATACMTAIKRIDKRIVKQRRAERLVVEERLALECTRGCTFVQGLRWAFQSENELFLAMDICEGGDLEQLRGTKKCLSEGAIKLIAAELVLAVTEMHSRGLMHRDIKPSNILLTADGHVRLADLGLACFVMNPCLEREFEQRRFSRVGDKATIGMSTFELLPHGQVQVNGSTLLRRYARGRAGTPGFWAPEMLSRDPVTGRSSQYGCVADWWSVGCTLCFLLSGHGPFAVHGGDTDEENRATLFAAPLIPSHAISRELNHFLTGLLAKDPSARLGFNGTEEVMEHPWFADVDWVRVERQELHLSSWAQRTPITVGRRSEVFPSLGLTPTHRSKAKPVHRRTVSTETIDKGQLTVEVSPATEVTPGFAVRLRVGLSDKEKRRLVQAEGVTLSREEQAVFKGFEFGRLQDLAIDLVSNFCLHSFRGLVGLVKAARDDEMSPTTMHALRLCIGSDAASSKQEFTAIRLAALCGSSFLSPPSTPLATMERAIDDCCSDLVRAARRCTQCSKFLAAASARLSAFLSQGFVTAPPAHAE
jgi:novel protein kinase C delta type